MKKYLHFVLSLYGAAFGIAIFVSGSIVVYGLLTNYLEPGKADNLIPTSFSDMLVRIVVIYYLIVYLFSLFVFFMVFVCLVNKTWDDFVFAFAIMITHVIMLILLEYICPLLGILTFTSR
jgi:hypothetical protein